MVAVSPIPWLKDIIEAIELIRDELAGVSLPAFAADKRKRWLAPLKGKFDEQCAAEGQIPVQP